jgi:hypothetical protein
MRYPPRRISHRRMRNLEIRRGIHALVPRIIYLCIICLLHFVSLRGIKSCSISLMLGYMCLKKRSSVLHCCLLGKNIGYTQVYQTFHTEEANIFRHRMHSKIFLAFFMKGLDMELAEFENQKRVKELLTRLLTALVMNRPNDPIQFMLDCLSSEEIPDKITPLVPKSFIVNQYSRLHRARLQYFQNRSILNMIS